MERESFIFYKSFYDASVYLSNEDKGKLFDMICQYGLYGKEIEGDGPAMGMFLLIKPQLDANNKRYIDGCKGGEFGTLGGAPKGNKNAVKTWGKVQKQPQNNPKTTPNDNDNDNVNDNENENGKIFSSFLSSDILVRYESYLGELFYEFSEEDLEQYKDILEDFVVYRCETDKKGTPRWKKQKTRSLGGRLRTRKKNADTNFGKNKPQLPTESLQNAAVMYYMNRNNPKQQKPYKEYLQKYGVLDKRKEYASMKLGSGFIS